MSFTITCSHCNKTYTIEDKYAGRAGKCTCGERLILISSPDATERQRWQREANARALAELAKDQLKPDSTPASSDAAKSTKVTVWHILGLVALIFMGWLLITNVKPEPPRPRTVRERQEEIIMKAVKKMEEDENERGW
jgi:hypothetical protein